MTKAKRYCIQKLETHDKDKRLTTWKDTKKCSENLEALKMLCPSRTHRIFDRTNGRVVFEP